MYVPIKRSVGGAPNANEKKKPEMLNIIRQIIGTGYSYI